MTAERTHTVTSAGSDLEHAVEVLFTPTADVVILQIGDTTYQVSSWGHDGFIFAKKDGTAYEVQRTRWGWRCDCPNFRHKGGVERPCKHCGVARLLAEGGGF